MQAASRVTWMRSLTSQLALVVQQVKVPVWASQEDQEGPNGR